MKIRAAMHLSGKSWNLLVYPVLNETTDHLLLKLAAATLFHASEPILSPSLTHPALREQEFVPDLMAVNDANEVTLWLECGKTTLHKLEKVAKRFRGARMVMLTAQPHEGLQMAESLPEEKWNRLEILAFAPGDFDQWRQRVTETLAIIGEADERSLNLVINNDVFIGDLQKIR